MKRTTLIAGLTTFSIGAAALSTAALAEKQGEKGRHHGPRFNFEEVDTNSDGKISKEEIAAHRAAQFSAKDTDGDGKLSAEELRAHGEERKAKRAEKRFERMMEKMDANGDGFLSADELEPKKSGEMFDRLDTDGDGFLSEEELKAHKGGKRGAHGNKGKDSN